MLDEENEILALAGKDEIHAARGRNRGLRRDDILTAFGLDGQDIVRATPRISFPNTPNLPQPASIGKKNHLFSAKIERISPFGEILQFCAITLGCLLLLFISGCASITAEEPIMATLAKKTQVRKSWSKEVFLSSRAARTREEQRGPFEISAKDASVLISAMQQPREISSALKSLVIESARQCSV